MIYENEEYNDAVKQMIELFEEESEAPITKKPFRSYLIKRLTEIEIEQILSTAKLEVELLRQKESFPTKIESQVTKTIDSSEEEEAILSIRESQ